jgi:hypothetical protein
VSRIFALFRRPTRTNQSINRSIFLLAIDPADASAVVVDAVARPVPVAGHGDDGASNMKKIKVRENKKGIARRPGAIRSALGKAELKYDS